MKITFILLLTLVTISSCRSEYEERLEMAKEIQLEIDAVKDNELLLRESIRQEIQEKERLINFHAKLSGNERLFFQDLMQH